MKKRVYLSSPDMTPEDRKLLLDSFDSNWIAPVGPHLDKFEEDFAKRVGMTAAAGLVNCTAGLHLALILLGVGKGDDVLVSTFTFAATANVIKYVGANPIFIDSNKETWNIDPLLVAQQIEEMGFRNKPPKAVIAVDLYGQSADISPIRKACDKWGVKLIQDCAESLGATYHDKSVGTEADIAVFSFNGNKIITTSGGGMLVSNDKKLVDKAKFLAAQAKDPAQWYQHTNIGYNYRLSNLLAAIGIGQLQSLDDKVSKRRSNFEFYKSQLGIPGVEFMPEASYGKSTRWLTCITIDPKITNVTNEQLRQALEKENIESRLIWKPMHLQPIFADCKSVGGNISEKLFEQGLCLPSGSSLTKEDLSRTVDIINEVIHTK